jgi:uncharacterized membrane protein YiaA
MLYGIFTAIGVVALVLAVATWISVLRNRDMSGAEKAVWLVAVLIFPIFGALVYFTVRRDW